MIRKLLMVGCMGIILPGLPQQFAVGLIITVAFMALSLRLQPWAHPGLNALNFFSLSFQTIVLFTGLVKSIAEFTEESVRSSDKAASDGMILVLTLMVAVVPAAILFAEGGFDPLGLLKARLSCLFRCCFASDKQAQRSRDLSSSDMTPYPQGRRDVDHNAKRQERAKQFTAIDADDSGGISIDELRIAMRKSNPEVTDEEVKRIFAALDTNKDNVVSKHEFLEAIVHRCRTCQAHVIPGSTKCDLCGDPRAHVSLPPPHSCSLSSCFTLPFLLFWYVMCRMV